MKQYQVKITDKALADMNAIYKYIADILKAPNTAIKQYDRIADAIESLNAFRRGVSYLSPRPSVT